jgi:E3 ubiquitin-protein ligase MYCBP2
MYKCAYYMCYQCKEPYFGGMKDCEQNQLQEREFKPEELVCSGCSNVGGAAGITKCKIKAHGSENIDFKCKFCCSVALWFCHGNTHYCDPCHMQAGRNKV